MLWAFAAPAQSAADRPNIEEVLARIGGQVEKFWQDLPAVTCTERMIQTKLDPRGKRIEERESSFDYTISLAKNGIGIAINESRVVRDEPPDKPKHSLLVSEGFSTLVLIFHPHFRPSFRFEVAPADSLQDPRILQVQFEYLAGMPAPSILQTRNRNVPIEWKGIAWVDTESWNIVRIQARLKKPMEVLGIQSLSSDVTYTTINWEGSDRDYLLPRNAVIEAGTVRQRWRNVHRFDAYRRFAVDTKLKLEEPE